ncbi:Queuine tRNA-ribosyltransferase [Fasciola gigantica]|uniref:Queuine tRNA-ribosyltransferase n=1 Tax=Fasciola gigantica TaxID=46835 RepID=A0A504YLB8_FASGI|nr:Queuine tRNA-ribosyltransferase [Fasciola gigantica]
MIAHPNGFQAPTDNDTLILPPNSMGRKRCWNSVMRTFRYLETVRECRRTNPDLSEIPLLVSIAGGNDLEFRKQSIKQTDFSTSSGVVIDGITTLPNNDTESIITRAAAAVNGSSDNNRDTSYLFSTLIPGVCAELPPELPRFITGIWQPQHIVLAVRAGVDLFDGSLPYRLTRSAVGWIYPGWPSLEGKESPSINFPLRYLVFPLDGSDDPSDGKYETPIQPGCDCFACTHHSRGYVSHMHIAKEMLGPMLLMIHNSHQYYRFFRDLRHCLTSGQIDHFIEFTALWEFPTKLLSVDRTFESKTAKDNLVDDVLPLIY